MAKNKQAKECDVFLSETLFINNQIETFFGKGKFNRILNELKEDTGETISKEKLLTESDYRPEIYKDTDAKEALKKFYKRNPIKEQLDLFKNDKGRYEIPKSYAKKIKGGIDFFKKYKIEIDELDSFEKKIDKDDYSVCKEYFVKILELRKKMINSLSEIGKDYTENDVDLLIITYYNPYAILQEWKIKKCIHGMRLITEGNPQYRYDLVDTIYDYINEEVNYLLEKYSRETMSDDLSNISIDPIIETIIGCLEEDYPEEFLFISEIYYK